MIRDSFIDPPRKGMALLAAVAAMAVVSALLVSVAWHFVANRRLAERRQEQLQVGWLARAGVELAIGRLLSEPKEYTGEKALLLPDSLVRVTVKPIAGSKDRFEVVSEARIPIEGRRGITRTETRRVRRVSEAGTVRIEMIPEELHP